MREVGCPEAQGRPAPGGGRDPSVARVVDIPFTVKYKHRETGSSCRPSDAVGRMRLVEWRKVLAHRRQERTVAKKLKKSTRFVTEL